MEEVKFKIKQGIKTGNADIDEYIEELHKFLISFETSNIRKLILSLDRLSGVIADDIDLIIEGNDTRQEEVFLGGNGDDDDEEEDFEMVTMSNLRILSDSKDSKVFDRLMTLFAKVESLNSVSKTAKSMVPAVEQYIEKSQADLMAEDIKIEAGGNSYEQIQEIHTDKRKGRVIV